MMEDYTKTTIEFYDKNIEEYIKKTKDLQDISWLKKFILSLPEKSKVLDLGCAFGRDCKYFIDHGFETYGVDLSKNMIEKAKKSVKKAKFYFMDVLDLKFQKAFFNGVWCSATLIHISKSDISKAIKEINRVLKKGGILYLNLKEGEGEKIVIDKRYNRAKKFYSYFTEKEIKDLLIKHGFKIINFKLAFDKKDKYRDTGIIYLIAEKMN